MSPQPHALMRFPALLADLCRHSDYHSRTTVEFGAWSQWCVIGKDIIQLSFSFSLLLHITLLLSPHKSCVKQKK